MCASRTVGTSFAGHRLNIESCEGLGRKHTCNRSRYIRYSYRLIAYNRCDRILSLWSWPSDQTKLKSDMTICQVMTGGIKHAGAVVGWSVEAAMTSQFAKTLGLFSACFMLSFETENLLLSVECCRWYVDHPWRRRDARRSISRRVPSH